MYIIDADTHISPTKERGGSMSVEELIRRMDYAGVDRALTWIQPPYLRQIGRANEYLYESVRKYPDRITGFGWADPRLGVEQAKKMARTCVEEYGFCGVKLNGAQNEYYIDDPELALPVIEEIASMRKVLAFHVGADAYEFTHPFRVAKIARKYPGMTILMVHMGGAAFADLSDASIEVAEHCPNVHLIGSAVKDVSVLKAIRKLGAGRVSFGSDSPFALMHAAIAMYEAILDGENLSEEEKQLIMGGNIKRILKI